MKNSRSKKIIIVISFVILLILIGLLRIFLFVNINNQLKENFNSPIFIHKNQINSISNFSNDQLMALKWGLTLLFTAIYLGISCLTVKLFFEQKVLVKITVLVYLLIVLICFLTMAGGYFYADISESAYQFSRYLMGIAQSPLVIMILIPLFKVGSSSSFRP